LKIKHRQSFDFCGKILQFLGIESSSYIIKDEKQENRIMQSFLRITEVLKRKFSIGIFLGDI